MDTGLSLFVLEKGMEPSFRDPPDASVIIVTDDKWKAYRYFFETGSWRGMEFWDESQEEACRNEGREYRSYKDQSEEEKNAIVEKWYESAWYSNDIVVRISLGDIKGLDKMIDCLTDPLKRKIVSLENQIKISALKESVGHLPSLPTEIFDLVIASHLE